MQVTVCLIGGATSSNGISEESINLKITYKLKALLEKEGINVILTRTDENGIYDSSCKTIREKKKSDAKNRVEIGNTSNADIFVSIHLNKIPQEQYWGWQTFYNQSNKNSQLLATQIQQGLNDSINKENKRESLKIENIYIVDNVNIPIAVVECGFLSNKEEESLLQTDEYQDKLAQGIKEGIINYFNSL